MLARPVARSVVAVFKSARSERHATELTVERSIVVAIKICGIASRQDAELCVQLAVDAVGLNFVPESVRAVSVAAARELSTTIGSACLRVGVVRDLTAQDVRDLLANVDLDVLQFHGSEPSAFCRQFDRPYVKVIGVEKRIETDVEASLDAVVQAAARDYHDACALLLDTAHGGASGGTGSQFDWRRWPASQVAVPLALAGGLNADNVAHAIAQTGCAAVDVSGGVEGDVRGVKDPARIEAFVAAARSAGVAG